MLAELEEIITYKKSYSLPEKQELMRKTWMKRYNREYKPLLIGRLVGCQRNVEVWQRMLKVRALVISPKENMEMWIKFANLCRKSGRLGLAEKSLNSLLDENEDINELTVRGCLASWSLITFSRQEPRLKWYMHISNTCGLAEIEMKHSRIFESSQGKCHKILALVQTTLLLKRSLQKHRQLRTSKSTPNFWLGAIRSKVNGR